MKFKYTLQTDRQERYIIFLNIFYILITFYPFLVGTLRDIL